MSLNVVWVLYTFPVSHECVTVSHLWLILMTEPVYLFLKPGPITKSAQVYVCVCVCLCKTWPPGIKPTCHCCKVLLGLIGVFHVCPVQVKTVDPSVCVGWVKPTETDSGDVQRQELNGCSLGKGLEVKPQTVSLTLSRQKVQLIAHNSGIQERKQPAYSTCAFSEMKRKNKSMLTPSAATRSK